jgi:hypothetical protein
MAVPFLYCPFTPKIHPDASAIHESSVQWAKSLGMFPTEQHAAIAFKAKAGWLAARAFPTATTLGLQFVADWTLLFCLLDDHLEKSDEANNVELYLEELLNLLRAETADSSADSFALGMIDLRQRLLALGPPTHLIRFTERVKELFSSIVEETRNRERAQIPDIASYVQLRATTVGLHVMFALSEILDGFSLSDRTREHPALQSLATRTSNIVGWANDLFTYEKEIHEGEIHNLVMVLMNERGLTLEEAMAQTVTLHDNEVRSFLQELDQLASFGLADAGVQGYVRMLKCWIRGHFDWALETGRYSAVYSANVCFQRNDRARAIPLGERMARPQAALAIATGDASAREWAWKRLEAAPSEPLLAADSAELERSVRGRG